MSLVNTRLQDFRANAPFDKWETRATRTGALEAFLIQTNDPTGIVTDELKQKAIASAGQALQIPVIDYDSGVSVANTTIPVTITDQANTSQLVNVTFADYYFGFLMYPSSYFNNEIGYQRDFNAKLQKNIYKLMDLLDTAAVAALEADKTQVLNDTLGGRYALTSNVVVAPYAERDAVIGDINPLQAGNDFYNQMHLVANASMESHVRNRLLEKGKFNTEDKTYQYNDKSFSFTNNLANGAGNIATAYAIPYGSLGVLQQFAPDCVQGNRSTDGHEWGIETLPIINIPMGTYTYEGAANASAINGAATALNTAAKVEAYGFHTRFAFLTPYNSDAASRASAIMKVAIAASA